MAALINNPYDLCETIQFLLTQREHQTKAIQGHPHHSQLYKLIQHVYKGTLVH